MLYIYYKEPLIVSCRFVHNNNQCLLLCFCCNRRSPHATGDIFKCISMHQEPVDVEKAVAVGAASAISNEDNRDPNMSSSSSSVSSAASARQIALESDREAQVTALEILHGLPGITTTNARAVMGLANSIAELSACSENQLAQAMGTANAKKLVQFFKQRIYQ